jgi:hypothetical protein
VRVSRRQRPALELERSSIQATGSSTRRRFFNGAAAGNPIKQTDSMRTAAIDISRGGVWLPRVRLRAVPRAGGRLVASDKRATRGNNRGTRQDGRRRPRLTPPCKVRDNWTGAQWIRTTQNKQKRPRCRVGLSVLFTHGSDGRGHRYSWSGRLVR